MAISITEGFTWANGNTVMPSRLNKAIRELTIQMGASKLLGTVGAGNAVEIDYTAAGLALLQAADAAAQRTLLGLVIGTNVQAQSANLNTFAGIAPSANVQSILSAADYAAIRTLLGLVIGTNVQAQSANLNTFAGIAPSANVQSVLSAADYAAIRTLLGLVIGTNVQAQSTTGTWTPSIGGTATYDSQSGTYTKVGRLVFIYCDIDLSSRGTGSQTTISGLPFAANNVGALAVGYYDDAAVSYQDVLALTNGSTIEIWTLAAGAVQTLKAPFFNNTTRIIISGCYETAS